ncbi:unnamed protein product [Rhizoctonia solani]|uniref:Glycoside hydrolase family 5 domain-containing protein n=1 Tax=Rhizoctonia solani TaxID=456999 RepID=A0A8H3E0K8_9AGAM|nr:unnamed protein product [Rhizoctonia solani]
MEISDEQITRLRRYPWLPHVHSKRAFLMKFYADPEKEECYILVTDTVKSSKAATYPTGPHPLPTPAPKNKSPTNSVESPIWKSSFRRGQHVQFDLLLTVTTPTLNWEWRTFALRPSHSAEVMSRLLINPMLTQMSIMSLFLAGGFDLEAFTKQLDKTSKTARITMHTHLRAVFSKSIVACGLTRISQTWEQLGEECLQPIVEELEDLEPHTAPLYFPMPLSEDEAESEAEQPEFYSRAGSIRSSPAPLPDADGSATEDEDEGDGKTQVTQVEESAVGVGAKRSKNGVHAQASKYGSKSQSQSQSQPRPSMHLARSMPHPARSQMSMLGASGGRSISQPQVAGQKRRMGSESESDEYEREEQLLRPTVAAKPKQCRVVNKRRGEAAAQNPFPVPTSTSPLFPTAVTTSTRAWPTPTAFDYSKDKIRGVNLGGWLSHCTGSTLISQQPWITPSLFENTGNENIVDEYTFNTLQDASTVQRVLRRHWETWIVEDDFRKIAEAGLNHVRLPFGYWSVPRPGNDPTPYNPDAWPYVMRALDWARKYNLFVIMDVHGAPGSQNGYDNSGQRMNMPQWHINSGNVNRTLDVIAWLAQTFGGPEYANLVTMIQLMNEPAGFYPELLTVLRDYYQRSYWIIRPVSDHLLVALHDGFQPLSTWSSSTDVPNPANTIMDTHIYQIFNDPQVTMSWDDKLKATCDYGNTLAAYTARADGFRTYVGEWTTSYTDCAKWLNGRGVGARLDGTRAGSTFVRTCADITGSMDKFSDDYKMWLRRYWDAQTIAYERGNGWVYWTWKAESADEWSYSKGLEGGWIPSDPTNHIYNAC